jgi:tRNA G10  N-methylase Trm11
MKTYYFILGRNPELSFIEIVTFLNTNRVSYNVNSYSTEVVLIDSENMVGDQEIVNSLGGTVKFGIVHDVLSLDEDETKLEKVFSSGNLTNKYFSSSVGKIHYGISLYDGGDGLHLVRLMEKKLLKFNLLIKEKLKENGINSGFVRIKERYISSVSVEKNRLLRNGAEIVIIFKGNQLFIGHTLSVQEYGGFSYRDMAKPNKDKKSGIMPPKLARIMLNLAKIGKDSVLLDPFCGSGTILLEAVILGIIKMIGSDISVNAVNDTRNNIKWIFDRFNPGNNPLKKEAFQIELFQSDVKKIPDKIGSGFVSAIVTEPYLGPPLYGKPTEFSAKRIISDLEQLYINAFIAFDKLLEHQGCVVIIFPVFEINSKIFFIDILSKLEKLGFIKEDLFNKFQKDGYVFDLSSRGTVLYRSREQFLTREIISFIKK